MKRKIVFMIIIFLFTLIAISTHIRHSFTFASGEVGSEYEIVVKLDSIIQKQAVILERIEDVEREVKNRCR